jgi:hypothetical protein
MASAWSIALPFANAARYSAPGRAARAELVEERRQDTASQRGLQRPVVRLVGRAAAGQQLEPRAQPVQDLPRRQRP